MFGKRKKYNNKTFTAEGIKWHSIWEYDCWNVLKRLEADGYIFDLQRQHVIVVSISGVEVCKCILDFYFTVRVNGIKEDVYADAKSTITDRMYKFLIQKKLLKSVYGIDVHSLLNGQTDVKKMYTPQIT